MTGQMLKDGAIIDPDAGTKPASPEGKPTVTVLDYGSGNVRSAVRALERAGAEVILSSKPEDVAQRRRARGPRRRCVRNGACGSSKPSTASA